MKILNFGSLNIDYVYEVAHIVQPGETIDSFSLNLFPGGKGLNQSIAIARAGASVYHAGMIGEDGEMLVRLLKENHVDCSHIQTTEGQTGSAVIQVDAKGQNCIILNGGANRKNSIKNAEKILEDFEPNDIILLQNEINEIRGIINIAKEKGLYIILNPSPMNDTVLACDLEKIDLFIMNEHEGRQITGGEAVEDILKSMEKKYQGAGVILTLGEKGAIYQDKNQRYRHGGYIADAVDTTAAGDTFTGYFIAMLSQQNKIEQCLDEAAKAAALAVTRAGAAVSIPHKKDVAAAALTLNKKNNQVRQHRMSLGTY